jgi:hypothetical protein
MWRPKSRKSDNLAGESNSKTRSFAFYQQKASSVTQAGFRDIQKGLQECMSTVVVFPDPLTPTPSVSWAMMTPENTEEGPHDLELAGENISKWNAPQISCTAQLQEQ